MEDIYFHVTRGNREVMVSAGVYRKGSGQDGYDLVDFAEFSAETTDEVFAYIKGGIDVAFAPYGIRKGAPSEEVTSGAE